MLQKKTRKMLVDKNVSKNVRVVSSNIKKSFSYRKPWSQFTVQSEIQISYL